MTTPTKRQIANGCRHFNGIQHDVCEAGIAYKQFLYENAPNFPCLARQDGTFSGACSAFAWRSEDEIEAEDKRMAEVVEKWLKDLNAGYCPDCGVEITRKRQVGRCVYADPCGHRLYQGKVE